MCEFFHHCYSFIHCIIDNLRRHFSCICASFYLPFCRLLPHGMLHWRCWIKFITWRCLWIRWLWVCPIGRNLCSCWRSCNRFSHPFMFITCALFMILFPRGSTFLFINIWIVTLKKNWTGQLIQWNRDFNWLGSFSCNCPRYWL